MNSHIAITSNGKPLVLPEDFSIDIDDQNPMFNDNEMFSYPVQMPLEGNRWLLGNIDDPMNVDRPVGLEHTKMRIQVDNMPFRSGTLVTSEDEEIDGALTMNISASENDLSDLIGTLTCRDIPVKDKIQIGEKIGAVTASIYYYYIAKIEYSGKKGKTTIKPGDFDTAKATFTPQALGFSYPGICETTGTKEKAVESSTISYANDHTRIVPKVKTSFINVSEPYPSAYYCNARVAYYHYDLDAEGETSSNISPASVHTGDEDKWPYWVLEADRPQSGICFYVLYFLDCLFDYLGVVFDNSALLEVEDMRRLCFFTTHCKYDEEYKYPNKVDSDGNKKPDFDNLDDINAWLESRGTGGKFEFRQGDDLSVNKVQYQDRNGVTHTAVVGEDGVAGIELKSFESSSKPRTVTANIMNMYANSDNFPDESVQTILDSLYNSFGIKFQYDYEKKKVTAYFVRDVFRSKEEPIELQGSVISMHKVAEKITGVRMKYSQESDSKEQQSNVKNGVKDYDTDYDYIDYPKKGTVTNFTYKQIFNLPYRSDATTNTKCYIDLTTGNAYRIKVNSDAETAAGLKPVLFEVGGYKGVEIGDCSEINDDFIQEFSSDFQPVIFNDVNAQQELTNASGSYSGDAEVTVEGGSTTTVTASSVKINPDDEGQILAAYIDEEMEHEFTEHRISQVLSSQAVEYYMDEILCGIESYDTSATEDGNSPLQEYDWGLAIAIMRGGGADAKLQTYNYNYDGFGNSKWRTVAGDYATSSDSLDNYGSEYDYNGTQSGVGSGERFSLKIRAWKQPDWADSPLIIDDVMDSDDPTVISTKIKSRGLFDTFMSEMANFYLKRRKYKITMQATAAQVADIPNHWTRRFRINGLVGFINKLSYTLSAKDGLQDLEIEFYVV